jgi:hypothetical protein
MLITSLRSSGCQQNPSMILPAAGHVKRTGDLITGPSDCGRNVRPAEVWSCAGTAPALLSATAVVGAASDTKTTSASTLHDAFAARAQCRLGRMPDLFMETTPYQEEDASSRTRLAISRQLGLLSTVRLNSSSPDCSRGRRSKAFYDLDTPAFVNFREALSLTGVDVKRLLRRL